MRSRLFQSSAFAGTPGELRRGIEIALRRYVFTSAVVLAVFSVLVRPATAQKYVGTIALPPGSDVYGSMAVDPQSGLLFLPSYDSGELLVADTATDTVIDAISSNRVISAVFDPANNLVYFTSFDGIEAIDATTGTFVADLTGVGLGIAANPQTGLIYMTRGNTVWVIDPTVLPSGQVIDIIDLTAAGVFNAANVVVNPVTNFIYVAAEDGVAVIDGTTDQVVTVLDSGTHSYIPTIAIDVELNLIYAPGAGGVTIIDGQTNQVTTTIAAKGEGMGVAVDPVTHRVYVTNDSYNGHGKDPNRQLLTIDGTAEAIVAKYPMPFYARSVVVNPATGLVYLAERYGDIHVFEDVPAGQ